MIRKISIFSFIFVAMILASCNDIIDEITGNGDGLKVEVVDSKGYNNQNATRATYSDTIHTEFDAGDAIGVYAYNADGELVSSNVKFTKQSDGSWTSESKVVYDPDLKYYGYYPYVSDAYTPSASSDNVDAKFADFIKDTDNRFWKADQSTKANYDASNLMIARGTVSGDRTIRFTMLHKRGLAVLSGSRNKWYYSTNPDSLISASITVEARSDSVGNYPYFDNTNSYFLVKPDTTTNIGGLHWTIDEGKYMVYTGSMLTGTPSSYEYSTSTDGGNTWSDFTSTSPSWLTVTPHVQASAATNFSVTPVATKTTNIVVDEPDATLQANTPVTDRDLSYYYNWGQSRGSRTTANCYLVHAAGTYRLPLVYGNAIVNGQTNTSAYHTTVNPATLTVVAGVFQGRTTYGAYTVSGQMLHNFVNHNGDGIYTGSESDPWIENHSITVDGARLIWQDVKGLVSSVGIAQGSDGKYLTFTINHNHIAEGNAVIAATSNGTVVWSWHIWVTNQGLRPADNSSVATDSITYNVAPVNLGYAAATYEGSKCRVRAIAANGLAVQFQMQQPNAKSDKTNTLTNTYYQWGRKDPFPPERGAYDIEGNAYSVTQNSVSNTTLQATIDNPGTYYATDYNTVMLYSEQYNNLWNTTDSVLYIDAFARSPRDYGSWYDAVKTVKTIYDPCPPDYCVPTEYLFHYMTYTTYDDYYNVTFTRTTNFTGHDGYTEWTSSSPHLYFPFSSYYSLGGFDTYEYGNSTNIWTSSNSLSSLIYPTCYGAMGVQLGNDNNNIRTNYSSMSYGMAVRPVYEN